MSLTATQPDTPTRRHLGDLAPNQPAITPGFDVRLSRTAKPGEPMSGQDRAWPGLMRRAGRAHLWIWRLGELVGTAELLMSELVTNGFQHGQSDTVRVRLWRTDAYVCIEVDSGSGPQRPCPRQAGPDDESGRGLQLVGMLADAWGVSDDGSRIWCLLTVDGA
ncbi:ATP-binding protein [Streptomyces katsurahamanus]|nr:ATP-binding protein [Streptomyces katsurahamanus]